MKWRLARCHCEICGAILHQPLRPVSQMNPQAPPQLETIIHKALEKDRNLRYQHASEMRADLSRLLRDSSSASGVQTDAGQFPAAASSAGSSWKPWVLASASAVVLLLAGFFYGACSIMCLRQLVRQRKPLSRCYLSKTPDPTKIFFA